MSFLPPKNTFFVAFLLLPFVVYLLGLAHTIQPADSAEFVTVAYQMGIAHPSGYPLYTLLGAFFGSIFPFEVYTNLSLFSAITAFLTLVFFYFSLLLLTEAKKVSWLGCMLLALSSHFWKHATHPEVFMLLVFWASVLFYIVLKATHPQTTAERKLRWGWAYFGIVGLASTHHLTISLTFPLGLFLLWDALFSEKPCSSRKSLCLGGICFFVLGLSPYLYLWIRGQNPPLNSWSQFSTLGEVFDHITRKEFGTFQSGLYKNAQPYWTYSLYYLKQLFFSHHWLGYGIAFFALFSWFWRKKLSETENAINHWKKEIHLLLLLTWILCGIGLATQLKMPWSPTGKYIASRFFVLPDFFFVALLTLGIHSVFWMPNTLKKRVLILFIFVSMLFYLPNGYKHSHSRRKIWIEKYAKDLLAGLPQGAYWIENQSDALCFGIPYLQAVKKIRQDVRFICLPMLARKRYFQECKTKWKDFNYSFHPRKISSIAIIQQALQQNKKVYVSTLYNRAIQRSFLWIPRGLAWEAQIFTPKPPELEKMAQKLKKDFDSFTEFKTYPSSTFSPWAHETLQRYTEPWKWLFRVSSAMNEKKIARLSQNMIKKWSHPKTKRE